MKYELDQLVYYIEHNKMHSAKILARMQVDNLHPDWNSTVEQKSTFTPFGVAGIFYATCHGIYPESRIYASRKEAAESL